MYHSFLCTILITLYLENTRMCFTFSWFIYGCFQHFRLYSIMIWWLVSWKGREKKRSWPHLRHCPRIYLNKLKKFTKKYKSITITCIPGNDLEPETKKLGVLATGHDTVVYDCTYDWRELSHQRQLAHICIRECSRGRSLEVKLCVIVLISLVLKII